MKFITSIFLVLLLSTTVLKASQTQMLLDKLAEASSADVARTIIIDIQEAWINAHSDQTEKLLMSKALSAKEWQLKVKVRSTRPPQDAIVKPKSDGSAKVELLEPEQGIAPGQACVFYDQNSSRVLGGGWINIAE